MKILDNLITELEKRKDDDPLDIVRMLKIINNNIIKGKRITPENLPELSRAVFAKYKSGENWCSVGKSYENLFAIGFQACAIRYVLNDDLKDCANCARTECRDDKREKDCYEDLENYEPII